jgi:hypothetical protein
MCLEENNRIRVAGLLAAGKKEVSFAGELTRKIAIVPGTFS